MRLSLFLWVLMLVAMPHAASAEILTPTDKVVEKFMEMDADESGGVSFREYKKTLLRRLRDRFHKIDTNNDDEINADEYRAFWTRKKAEHYRLRR